MTALHGQATARADLTVLDVAALFMLFHEYYDQATPELFQRDLNGKNWVLRLYDDTGDLQGFSTLALYETCISEKRMSIVFSGDTIIRPPYWGTPELPRIWSQTVLDLSREMPQPLYWFLISSGYKTYRFLPVFYQEFYPRYDRPTPSDIQRIMDTLATERFGDEYRPDLGIIRFRQGATPLREGIADVSAERLRDPHIAFFVQRDPGYVRGDELVCLTRIHPDNFTAAGRRIFRTLSGHA